MVTAASVKKAAETLTEAAKTLLEVGDLLGAQESIQQNVDRLDAEAKALDARLLDYQRALEDAKKAGEIEARRTKEQAVKSVASLEAQISDLTRQRDVLDARRTELQRGIEQDRIDGNARREADLKAAAEEVDRVIALRRREEEKLESVQAQIAKLHATIGTTIGSQS
jgi:chromosome segregation ATPase